MKNQTLLLTCSAAMLLLCLLSCKKQNNNDNKTALNGKWQETRFRTYMVNNGTTIIDDTTYTQPFTNLDYIQFTGNGNCTLSSDHEYYNTTPGNPNT